MATKNTPITIESGLSQLLTLSPAAFPTGTRTPAMAPTTVPRKNGVRSELSPKSNWAAARPRARRAVWWKANPDPRSNAERGEALSPGHPGVTDASLRD